MMMMIKVRTKDLNFEVLCRSVYALIGPGNVTLPPTWTNYLTITAFSTTRAVEAVTVKEVPPTHCSHPSRFSIPIKCQPCLNAITRNPEFEEEEK